MVKIPVGIPQMLQFRGQDPGWDTSNFGSFEVSSSGSRLGYLKIFGFVVKTSIGICHGQNPGWDKSRFETS